MKRGEIGKKNFPCIRISDTEEHSKKVEIRGHMIQDSVASKLLSV